MSFWAAASTSAPDFGAHLAARLPAAFFRLDLDRDFVLASAKSSAAPNRIAFRLVRPNVILLRTVPIGQDAGSLAAARQER
jgi:hypothetical protein